MENQGQNKMAVMPMGRLLFSMSLPLMVSLLVQSLYNIVDSIFVARISEDALTATSIAYPMQILMVAVSVGTAVGVNSLISQKLGARKQKEADQAATTGLILAICCTAVFMILGFFFPKYFAEIFTDDPVTADLCTRYLRICMIFCAGIFVETFAQRLLQATGNTLLSMVSLVVGAGLNIILDPMLIFGIGFFPEMGIEGAAVATVIGQWCGMAVALLLNAFKNPELHFAFRGYRLKWKSVADIYRVGLPTIVMQAMGTIMVSAVNMILMPFSSTAVAFFGVYFRLQNFLMMPINGLGQAVIPIIGYNYGAMNKQRINDCLRRLIPTAVIIALVGTLIFMAFPGGLLSLFSASDVMLEIGIPALRIISITFAPAAVTVVLGFAASGLGNGVINMIGTAIRQFILLVPLFYLFASLGDISQIWYAFWISEAVAVIYAIIAFRRELRKKVGKLSE